MKYVFVCPCTVVKYGSVAHYCHLVWHSSTTWFILPRQNSSKHAWQNRKTTFLIKNFHILLQYHDFFPKKKSIHYSIHHVQMISKWQRVSALSSIGVEGAGWQGQKCVNFLFHTLLCLFYLSLSVLWSRDCFLSTRAHTEQLRLLATQGRPLELSRVFTLCQRLVEETESVGEEGGGKLSSSKTATPTLLRRVNMQDAATHLLLRGLYFSMEFRLELPSFPPTAYSQPSMATRSWVLLKRMRIVSIFIL